MMNVSENWNVESAEGDSREYLHTSLENVRLHVSSRTEKIGDPRTVHHVNEMIGKNLNGKYGGFRTRDSLGGNTMIEVLDRHVGVARIPQA